MKRARKEVSKTKPQAKSKAKTSDLTKRAEAQALPPVEVVHMPVEKPAPHVEKGGVVFMTTVFIGIILILPFLMDYVAQLIQALGGPQATFFFQTNRWLTDVAGYVPIYLFTLFYLKTTFNPLSYYGYRWNKQYLNWAVYFGIGSGIIIYLMDRIGGISILGVSSFSLTAGLGYVLAWVILPSLTEETLFRGVIQGFYQRRSNVTFTKYGIHIGVFIASLFEIAFHLSAPIYYGITSVGVMPAVISHIPQLIYVAIFGAIGGYLYQRTGSLACPIIIHALGNFTELLLIWLLH